MIRKIIHIDESRCNGCGACANACHENAIEIINGKAKLIREDYCDGLGDCLPACPTDAITFEEREALEYDENAVNEHKKNKRTLSNWPCQIKLVPVSSSFFNKDKLIIAADCTAFAKNNIHNDLIKDNITIIGCPKLDNEDYNKKLKQIFITSNINQITVIRMEVPCCQRLELFVKKAIEESKKNIELEVVIITVDGKIKK